ncbi:MAG: sigma-70 family RNA polymerase sigma factor [Burkholderiales bacterium]|nr:sigma-70 family RNA polymerase sigma factor [Bacteroidia bacterium]
MDYIKEIKSGNETVLVELYKLYRNEFLNWSLIKYKINKEDGKDIFQDTVIAFYNNVKSETLTHLTSDIKTYLFTIGKFKIINFQKKQQRSVTFSDFDLLKVNEPINNEMLDKEENEFIKDTVKKYLNEQCEDCKKVLELYYFKDLDMKTIALEMGYKNADVAKKKKYECFKKLAEMVRKNLTVLVF